MWCAGGVEVMARGLGVSGCRGAAGRRVEPMVRGSSAVVVVFLACSFQRGQGRAERPGLGCEHACAGSRPHSGRFAGSRVWLC